MNLRPLPTLLLFLAACTSLTAQVTRLPLSGFIENRGQWDAQVRFQLRLPTLTLWVTDWGAVYDYVESIEQEIALSSSTNRCPLGDQSIDVGTIPSRVRGRVVRVEFINASQRARAIGESEITGRVNFLIGSDSNRWGRNCRIYSCVRINDLYDGIDVALSLEKGIVRSDLIVAPDADIEQVRMVLDGIDAMDGRCSVPGHVDLVDVMATDTTGEHDPHRAMVAGPLIYATFLGGNGGDQATDIAIDAEGNAYVVGRTETFGTTRQDFPVTSGAYVDHTLGARDVFITKIDTSGSRLHYSTLIGGTGIDLPWAIQVDAQGNAYVTGYSEDADAAADDFPTTPGAFNTTNRGYADAFVLKLDSSGSRLIYSTLIGGEGNDAGSDIALAADGSAVVVGTTEDAGNAELNFPTSANAYDRTHNGDQDGFALKIDPSGAALAYATFLGAAADDGAYAVAIDRNGNAVIGGGTTATASMENDFPTTAGAYGTTHNGGVDAFITKLNAGGTGLIYSTLLGGASSESVSDIVLDANGSAVFCGQTNDTTDNYPTTPGAYRTTHQGGFDGYVTKLGANGAELIYSTFIGGARYDLASALAIDIDGRVYLTGYSEYSANNRNMETTENAYSRKLNGGFDAIVVMLNADGSRLDYSSFIGGEYTDIGWGIAVDAGMNVYIAGRSDEAFPVTPGAFDRTHGEFGDAFAMKMTVSVAISSVLRTDPIPSSRLELR